MTDHPQVPLAGFTVDEGIAPLISKLVERGVPTEFSCQGFVDGVGECFCHNAAYIAFTHDVDAHWFFGLVWRLSRDCQMERWLSGGIVRFSPESIDDLTEALKI